MMKFIWKAGVAVALLAGVFTVGFTYLGVSSKANLMDMEERFNSIAVGGKLPTSETKGTYSVDRAHSYVGFRVKHMGLVEVPGSFKSFQGKINFDSKKVKNSSVEFSIDVKSIDTRINGRDNHLRSKDFFMVEKYPKVTFKSTRLKKKGKTYRVYGSLTMKDVTKEVMIPFRIYGPIKDRRGNIKMGVRGGTVINRRDFNVNYGNNLPSGVPVISDDVNIDIQLETALRKPKKSAKD